MQNTLSDVLVHARAVSGFTPEDEAVIREASEILATYKNAVVKDFYDALFSYEPTARVFAHAGRKRAEVEATLGRWYDILVRGDYDDLFWEWNWFIGLAHVQAEVRNTFMLSAMGRLQSALLSHIVEDFEELSAKRVYGALLRLTNCLSTLIAESYHMLCMSCIDKSGIKSAVFARMIALEVREQSKNYRRL